MMIYITTNYSIFKMINQKKKIKKKIVAIQQLINIIKIITFILINPILFYRVLTTQHKIFFKMTIFKFKELACFQTININFMKSKIFRNSTNKKIMIFCGKRKNLDF